MGICMTTDAVIPPDTVKINTEIKTSSKSSPAKCTPLDGAPFHHWNELNQMQDKMPTSAEDSSDPVFVIDASIMEKLPTSSDSPIRKQNYTELPKRVPIVIQRTIKKSEIYNIPKINIIFVLDTEVQRSEIISNLKHLTEISGRLHHVDMMPTFLEVVSTIGSQDINIIPPPKALEVFISRISSEIENVDAVLVTGYPRNMRDVVEYVARVQRISGVILLLDPRFQLFECDDNSTNDIANKEFNMTPDSIDSSNFRSAIFPVIQFFKQEELLYVVTLERTFLEIFHDIYDKVLLILSHLPQSPTHEIMSTEKEDVDSELANRKGSAIVGRPHNDDSYDTLTSPVHSTSSTLIDEKMISKKQSKSTKYSNLQHNILNKDVQDVLSLVQAGSIMERVSSVHSKSKKK